MNCELIKRGYALVDRNRGRQIEANGVEDSPIANRGCVCRSMRTTRWPRALRARASMVPANPEPTMTIVVALDLMTSRMAHCFGSRSGAMTRDLRL